MVHDVLNVCLVQNSSSQLRTVSGQHRLCPPNWLQELKLICARFVDVRTSRVRSAQRANPSMFFWADLEDRELRDQGLL